MTSEYGRPVVEHHDVALAGNAAGNHVRVMDHAAGKQSAIAAFLQLHAEVTERIVLAVVRAHLPHGLAGLVIENVDHRLAVVADDVLGMKTLIARVIPLVRAEPGGRVLEVR